MKVLIIGGTSFIGYRLAEKLWSAGHEVTATTRATCDLLNLPATLPYAEVVYLCAAMTRFIDCEADWKAHAINVDAPPKIARLMKDAWAREADKPIPRIIYTSSEAVYRAPHTLYGQYKWRAEAGLRHECDPIIVRLSKVTGETLDACCDFLVNAAGFKPGIYDWPS